MHGAKTIFKLIHVSHFLHVKAGFLWNNCAVALKKQLEHNNRHLR